MPGSETRLKDKRHLNISACRDASLMKYHMKETIVMMINRAKTPANLKDEYRNSFLQTLLKKMIGLSCKVLSFSKKYLIGLLQTSH